MRCLVTGCAGFIGSNLVDRLLQAGHSVIGYDNFSTGQRAFLASALQSQTFELIQDDLLNPPRLSEAMRQVEVVYHMAANADVRFGTEYPRRDLEQNTMATFNVLEAMRQCGVRRIAFASTGSVYGEPEIFPTPETAPFPVQTSLYGASKLACEGLLQAYAEGFGVEVYIFRFVSILGERYTHGHVFDFYRQLRDHPERLDILGDGKQRKSYLYVQDCIDAILVAMSVPGKVNIYNLGADEYCEVNDSVGWICGHMQVSPTRQYSGGVRGWVGDSPFIFLDCSRMRSLGWKPRRSIKEGIIQTLQYLQENPWLLEARQ